MKLKLTVDGHVYEVDVEVAETEPALPSYVPPAGQSSAAASPTSPAEPPPETVAADESKVCRSPISGVVVGVVAQAGQAIQAHDVLLVLEAMKMETQITAPRDGIVAEIHCGVGDSVKNGQVLLQFE